MKKQLFTSLCVTFFLFLKQVNTQSGPDPWHNEDKSPNLRDERDLPPDLRIPVKARAPTVNKLGNGEWFFRRILAIVLKGGQKKDNEDGSVEVSLQMKFDSFQWKTLGDALNSDIPLSEDMLRRTLGYVENAIYRPSIVEHIAIGWAEYVQAYLIEYKANITWTLMFMAFAGGVLWLWKHLSHKTILIIVFILFYAYEVVISYKEAEQKELEKFLSAIEVCKWRFWTTSCEAPQPDVLVFMKHMNPMKIGIRMCTSALAEPIVVLSSTIESILHGVTDGLFYPFNKITYGILTVVINVSLIYMLVMIIFNWILNIPFGLGFGLISIGQRRRKVFSESTSAPQPQIAPSSEHISQATLDKILNVCSLALSNNSESKKPRNNHHILPGPSGTEVQVMRRSASTGRLPNLIASSGECNDFNHIVKRKNIHNGSGDAAR